MYKKETPAILSVWRALFRGAGGNHRAVAAELTVYTNTEINLGTVISRGREQPMVMIWKLSFAVGSNGSWPQRRSAVLSHRSSDDNGSSNGDHGCNQQVSDGCGQD